MCRILSISLKMLINTVISDEATNELTLHAIFTSKSLNILPTRTSFFISIAEKNERCRNSKSFSSSCFNAGDSQIKILC